MRARRARLGATKTVRCRPDDAAMIFTRASLKAEFLRKKDCRLLFRRAAVQAEKAMVVGPDGAVERIRDCDALDEARKAFAAGTRCERR